MTAVDTTVRDRISEYLAGRGGFSEPMTQNMEWASGDRATQVRWTSTSRPDLSAVLDSYDGNKPTVWVESSRADGLEPNRHLTAHADAPDLLARLGETLDRLGV